MLNSSAGCYSKLIKLQLLMQVKQENNFLYEERNENFPQSTLVSPGQTSGIGKIIARYRNKLPQSSDHLSRKQAHHHHHLSTVSGLNYSQIYNDLKINKSNHNGQDNQAPQPSNQQGSQTSISKAPFNFQSAIEIRNQEGAKKKVLPGIILHTPKNADVSFYSRDQQVQQISSKKAKGHRQFRISEVREKYEKKQYLHQLTDLSINGLNENSSQFEAEPTNRSGGGKTDRTNTNINSIAHKQSDNKMDEKVAEQKPLSNSRSIGVGNHRIEKKDLETTPDQIQASSPVLEASNKNRSRYPKEEENQRKSLREGQVGDGSYNPQQIQSIRTRNFNERENDKHSSKKTKVYSFQQMENVHIQDQHASERIPAQSKQQSSRQKGTAKEQNKGHPIVHFQSEQAKEEGLGLASPKIHKRIQDPEDKMPQPRIEDKSRYSAEVEVQTEKEEQKQRQKEKKKQIMHEHISMEVSRVASTIKPKGNQVENHDEPLENEQEVQLNLHFEPVADEAGDNILAELKQSQPKEERPHPQQLEKQDYISSFNVQEYSKVYNILKSIQISLKSSVMNVQQILRCIKCYLEIIAIGNLDNIDEFDLPLHKKKIIKNSLFLERVAMIVLAFTYTTHTIKQSLKYILNMVTYSINNCLVLIKVLEETQINKDTNKKQLEDSAFAKSDRLAMKRNLDTLRNNNNVLMDVIQKLSKGEELFYENLNHIVKLISKSSLEQTFYSLLEYFSFFLCVSQLDHMIPFLAVAPNPYLSPMINNSKYTLVIDVVQIFCFGTKKSKTSIFRPYTQHFLTEMSQYYEIISFSPMFPTQIDKIIDMLDPKGHITHRLYKHHAINNNNQSLKSLDRIGRNIDEMILLDNENVGGAQCLENCIHVPMWKGSKNDTILAELCPLLAMIALKKIPAQEAAAKVRDQSTKNKKEGVKYISFGISLD